MDDAEAGAEEIQLIARKSLFQGPAEASLPCAGFRLPTDTEWEAEWVSWSSSNSAGAFGSPVKLVAAGCRGSGNGSLSLVDGYGFYWSSTVLGYYALGLNFGSGLADAGGYTRVLGFSVRCLKD